MAIVRPRFQISGVISLRVSYSIDMMRKEGDEVMLQPNRASYYA